MTDPTTRVFPNVEIGDGAVLGDYVIVGEAPAGAGAGEIETVIGAGARIRSHSVIYAGVRIGAGFQSGHHALVREFTVIGDDVSIGSGTVVEHHVTIEDGVRVHSNAFVPEYTTLKQGCWIGPGVVLTNAKYPRSPNVKNELAGPTVMPGAKIGANATVLPGVTIGENALVGAGSVVVEDVPAESVVAGNPARFIKKLSALPYDVAGDPNGSFEKP